MVSTDELRRRLTRCIDSVDGHAEIWRVFEDGDLFGEVTHALAKPWEPLRPTKVVGIEARGFILGAAVAHALGAGFVAIRKEGGLFPGTKLERIAQPDYRGLEHRLRLRRDGLSDSDRVVLIDDWCERGSQALAAKEMVEECGSVVLGLGVVVDESAPGFVAAFPRFVGLIRAKDLAKDSA